MWLLALEVWASLWGAPLEPFCCWLQKKKELIHWMLTDSSIISQCISHAQGIWFKHMATNKHSVFIEQPPSNPSLLWLSKISFLCLPLAILLGSLLLEVVEVLALCQIFIPNTAIWPQSPLVVMHPNFLITTFASRFISSPLAGWILQFRPRNCAWTLPTSPPALHSWLWAKKCWS